MKNNAINNAINMRVNDKLMGDIQSVQSELNETLYSDVTFSFTMRTLLSMGIEKFHEKKQKENFKKEK